MTRIITGMLVGIVIGVAASVVASPGACGECLTNSVRSILDEIHDEGWLGLIVTTNSQIAGSVHVLIVQPDSPALEAGFVSGDRIVRINGTGLGGGSARETMDDYRNLLDQLPPGQQVRFSVRRGDQLMEIDAVLAVHTFFARRDAVGAELIRRTNLGNYVPGVAGS